MGTRAQLRTRIRNDFQQWPDTDSLVNTISASATTLTINDGTRTPAGSLLEIESELMMVRSVSGNVLTVRRGDQGTTAAAHSAAVLVLIHELHGVTNLQLNDLINDGIEWLFPICVYEVWDNSLTTDDTVLSYTIPTSVEYVDELWITDGLTPESKKKLRYWTRVGSKIYLPGILPDNRQLIVHGWGRFTLPTDDTTSLCFGTDLEPAVEYYVVAAVIKIQEALRTRFTGQSAFLEARAGNVPELIGSFRDWMARAREIRGQHQTIRPSMLRKINRHG